MKQKKIFRVIVSLAVALAFVLPGVTVFANISMHEYGYIPISVVSDNHLTGSISTDESTDDLKLHNSSMRMVLPGATISGKSEDITYVEPDDSVMADRIWDSASAQINTIGSLGKIIYVGGSGPGNYSTIQEGINAASDGDTVFVFNGTYYETVVVNKQIQLIGESRENTVIDAGGTSAAVNVVVSGVYISDFTMMNGEWGIYMKSVSNNSIVNCDCHSNSDWGIQLLNISGGHSSNHEVINCNIYNNRYGLQLYYPRNCEIRDCTFYDNWGYYGVGTHFNSNNRFINCTCYNNAAEGFDLQDASNTVFINCTSYNNRKYGFRIFAYFYSARNNKVLNCAAYGNSGYGIYLRGFQVSHYSNADIVECTVCDNSGYGIYSYDSSDSNIVNCEVYNNNYGIYFWGYSNSVANRIVNCEVYNNSKDGISFYYSSDCNIENCNSYNNQLGIYLSSTPNSNIVNSNVCSNSEDGVYLSSSSDCTIANCTISANSGYGIHFWASSNCNITNCATYNSSKDGIYLHYSLENNITYCSSYNNQYGLYAISISKNNLIHHNNFVNNVENAYDECSNVWDDGSEGNYWDDYTGVDEDGDGIGDTPYNISGGSNQDRYPLMSPLDKTLPVITDVQASPDVQTTTEPVNITCTVTDNWDLVDTAKVIIDGPEGFVLEAVMNEGYWYENVYTAIGVYYYYIWANDTSKNIAVSDIYSFIIHDGDLPISCVDPLLPWTKAVPFTVTATAFDNIGVTNVTLYSRYSEDGTEWTEWTSYYGTDEEEPWSWEFTGDEGDGYYEFYSIAVDDYGNVEDPPSTADASTGLDTITPVTTHALNPVTPDGENDWYVSSVTVTLSAIDALSGVKWTWYQIDSGSWNIYMEPFTVSDDGEHVVSYYSVDLAGNREETHSVDFKIDKTPPVTTLELGGVIGKEGWFVSNVTVTLSAEDAISGVNYTVYKLNNSDWTVYEESFIVTEDGDHILYYYSVDLAGNIEPTNEVEFKIEHDTRPPVTTHHFDGVMGDNNWFVSNVTVTLTAVDDSAGVDYTMYKLNEGEWMEYEGSFLVTDDAVHTLCYYSVDRVGNKEVVKEVELKIDQTSPTINLTWDGENSKLVADVIDNTSGIAKVEFYLNGKLLGEVTETPYEWEVSKPRDKGQAIVYDKAGNEAISPPVDAVSQSTSQSQSISSTPVQHSTMNPDIDIDADTGRVSCISGLFECSLKIL